MKKKQEKIEFPYQTFPFLVIHRDGKDLMDTKKCYFQCIEHADKYIARNNFKQKDYQLHIKPGAELEDTGSKKRKKI